MLTQLYGVTSPQCVKAIRTHRHTLQYSETLPSNSGGWIWKQGLARIFVVSHQRRYQTRKWPTNTQQTHANYLRLLLFIHHSIQISHTYWKTEFKHHDTCNWKSHLCCIKIRHFNLSHPETSISWANKVNTIAADALPPDVTRFSGVLLHKAMDMMRHWQM